MPMRAIKLEGRSDAARSARALMCGPGRAYGKGEIRLPLCSAGCAGLAVMFWDGFLTSFLADSGIIAELAAAARSCWAHRKTRRPR